MDNQKFVLYVISHTHWDREWYSSFQDYRVRLVRTIDDLLDILDNDENYKFFHMDGQTIILEDYLSIRPQNKERIEKYIKNGRIIIGPWYVMPDEFLVTGESLVRNIQRGLDICRKYEVAAMNNGYVTDIFGHNGQFPQIVREFGMDSATLFRGVGDFDKDMFNWRGVDGSEILAFRMDVNRCYSNYYFSIRWPFEQTGYNNDDDLIERARQMIERSKKASVCNAFLMLDGVDHIDADPELPRIINLLNSRIEGIEVRHATMDEYLEAVKAANLQLETLEGPLYNIGRKGLQHRVLKNVLSSMVHIKQENDRCETLMTAWAEPLDAATRVFSDKMVNGRGAVYGQPRSDYFNEAWRYIISNHPHDSICGCSITDVHKDNDYRFRQAEQIGENMVRLAMDELGVNIDTSGLEGDSAVIVFNQFMHDIDETVILKLQLKTGQFRNFRLFDACGKDIPYQILEISEPWQKRIAPIRKLICFESYETITIAIRLKIPGNGYASLGYKHYQAIGPQGYEYAHREEPDATRYPGTFRTARNVWDNGVLKVTVKDNGTLLVKNKRTGKEYDNVLAFEDCADVGDGWNYVKPAADSEYISLCGDCDFSVESDGPLAAVLKVTRRIKLPRNAAGSVRRSADRDFFEVISCITIIKDSTVLDIRTEVDNKHNHHRLRVLFPTGMSSKEFYTHTPFDMQRWSVEKSDWSTHSEIETNVNPTQGVVFISDGQDSFGLYSKGLYEVEVTENDCTVALTLFRSFPHEVGQVIPEWGLANMKMIFEYAADFGVEGTPASALAEGMKWKIGLRSSNETKHGGSLPGESSLVKFDCGLSIISSMCYTKIDGTTREALVIRMYNPSDERETVKAKFPSAVKEAYLLDLKNDITGSIDISTDTVSFDAGAHKIVSFAVQL